MGVTINYNRPKSTQTNSTGMAIRTLYAERPNAPVVIDGINTPAVGSTGIAEVHWDCDADESGGADIQVLGKLVITPAVDANGTITFTAVFTPVLGDETDGAAQTHIFGHPESMDAWQTAAGRARQA